MTTDVMKRNQSLTYDRINQVQDAVDQNKKSNEDISKNLEVNILHRVLHCEVLVLTVCEPIKLIILTSFLKVVKGRVVDCVADFDSLKSTFEKTSDKINSDMDNSSQADSF